MTGVAIEGLSFSYPGRDRVIDELDLEVAPGMKLGILGASGAGKSTLLGLIFGLLSGTGSISISDLQLGSRTLNTIRSRIGLVMQNPDDQLFHATVLEDVVFGPRHQGLAPAEADSRARAALADLGLTGFEDRACHELSFGEKRRVALAGVLAMRPAMIALDEPFANLAPALIADLVKTIRSLDATVLLVTQDLLPALCCCDELAILDGGAIRGHDDALTIARDAHLLSSCGLGLDLWREALAKLDGSGESAAAPSKRI